MRSRIHPIVFLVGALVIGSSCLWMYHRGQAEREVDRYMAGRVAHDRFSGVVLISRNGEVLFNRSFGFANAEWRIPNSRDTKFQLASITKTFTATTIMLLQRDGLLSLTDSICKFIEPCPRAWEPITIRHLLTHTSGIAGPSGEPDFAKIMGRRLTREEMLDDLRSRPTRFAPGKEFLYSNAGYFLLGLIIERTTGASFDRVLAERIFEPLGMHDSGFDDRESILAKRAGGYSPQAANGIKNAPYMDPAWSFASGNLYATASDLNTFADGIYAQKILPRAALEEMWSAALNGYGYGWSVVGGDAALGDHRAVLHSGHSPGFVNCLVLFPDDRLTIIVLANYEMQMHACTLARNLAAIAFDRADQVDRNPDEINLAPDILKQYVGTYRFSDSLSVAITFDGAHLVAHSAGLPLMRLLAESESEFFLEEMDVRIAFHSDAKSGVTVMTVHAPLQDERVATRTD